MGCCQRCCTNTCLTVLTLITLGATLGFLIFATYEASKVRKVNDTVFIILVVVTCITGMIFIFGIYASCCGNRCARGALSVIYLVYALILLACGIVVIIFRTKFSKFLRDSYDEGKFSDKDLENIEDTFSCKFPSNPENATKLTLLEDNSESCFTKFDDFCKKFGIIIGIVLLVLFVLIFIGVVIACNAACRKRETSSGSKTKEQVSTPLTYGW